jgi:hypothetical protein
VKRLARRGPSRAATGWILLGVLLGYAFAIHHGIGPPGGGLETGWWTPNGWLITRLQTSSLAPLIQSYWTGVLVFGLPAVALAVWVFVCTGSSVARTLALAAVLATGTFLYYGLHLPRLWEFFHLRWSGVMAAVPLVAAAALLTPLLARSWLRLPRWAQLVILAGLSAVIVVTQRNVTGTNPRLLLALSPWPLVPLSMEFGATWVGAVFAVAALACAGLAASRGRAVAAGLVGAGLVGGSLAAGIEPRSLTLGVAALAAAALFAARRAGDGPHARAARALGVGVLLAAGPLLAGHWLKTLDYEVTRNRIAQRVIDALSAYYERERLYPEKLEDLVASRDLDEIPKPQIGFAALSEESFVYQNFGTSYLLEFSAPGWVQCAYNPPWSEDDDALEEPEDLEEAEGGGAASNGEGDGESLPGAWSCEQKPPELF